MRRAAAHAAAAALALTACGAREPDYCSPCALAPSADGKILYVADAGRKQIIPVGLGAMEVGKAIGVDGTPAALALAPQGLLVALAEPEGKVVLLSPERRKILAEIRVGHTPSALAVSPDGAVAYAANRYSGTVSVLDLKAAKETARIPVGREPIALVVSPDGKTLFVANHLPSGPANKDYTGSTVTIVDLAAGKVAATLALPNGSTALRGMCITPDGRFVYVTHILARYQLPTTQLERGWMNTNAMTIIDAAGRKCVNTVLLDDVDQGAAIPWGIAITPDGARLCVAHAGTHELSIIDRAALHAKLEKAAAGTKVSDATDSADDVPNDLAFLLDMRLRVKLPGNGPRAVWAAADRAYVGEYFTADLVAVPLPEPRPRDLAVVRLAPEQKITQVRLGEIYFHDAALCFQQWQSCATCHPDSRADSLNWDLLNDGIGNPKQTKNMLLAHATPPSMMTGIRSNAETAVRAGIRFIQFAVRPEEDAQAIDAYLKSLTAVPSPLLERGRLSKAATRGKKVFERAECAKCHPPPLFTDMKDHEIGLAVGLDVGRPLDTPTLIECWRTAPYLNDGRAATMRAVLDDGNPENKHGSTLQLSDEEMADLEAYVLSL